MTINNDAHAEPVIKNPFETSPVEEKGAVESPLAEEASAEEAATEELGTEKSVSQKPASQKPHGRPVARRLPLLAWIRYYLPARIHRPLIKAVRKTARMWGVDGADWYWMANNPVPLKSLNRSLWRTAEPSFNYYIMLFLSSVISALGLLAGSTAAIIGAMIVAPLMGPITGMAFAMTMGNRRLLKRSGLAVITGALLTVGTAYLICTLVGLNTLNDEILERTRPTLIDLAIGLAAGAAGSFAKTRREVADALPGVAIAVALVPPLSVIGIGLAYADVDVISGSTLLFLTNLAGIILSGGLIFVWQNYGSMKRAKRGLTASILLVCLLGIPLGLSLRDLVIQERTRSLVSSLIRRDTETFGSTNIRRLRVTTRGRLLRVNLDVGAPVDSISANQVNLVQQFLEDSLERPVILEVSVFPLEEFSAGNSMQTN